MSPQRTRTVHFAAGGPSTGAYPALSTKNHPTISRGMSRPPFRQQNTQQAKERLNKIIWEIKAEYAKKDIDHIKSVGANEEIRDMLQKEKKEKEVLQWCLQEEKREKEELQRRIQEERTEKEELQRHIQAAEDRAWGYEKQVNTLTVQLESRKTTPPTDQQE